MYKTYGSIADQNRAWSLAEMRDFRRTLDNTRLTLLQRIARALGMVAS